MKNVQKVALGAAGVALATGAAVAAGAALKNKKTRAKIQKGARKALAGASRIQRVLEEGKEKYQSYQHRIGLNKGKKRSTKKRGMTH